MACIISKTILTTKSSRPLKKKKSQFKKLYLNLLGTCKVNEKTNLYSLINILPYVHIWSKCRFDGHKKQKQKAYSIFWSTSIKVFLLQVNWWHGTGKCEIKKKKKAKKNKGWLNSMREIKFNFSKWYSFISYYGCGWLIRVHFSPNPSDCIFKSFKPFSDARMGVLTSWKSAFSSVQKCFTTG